MTIWKAIALALLLLVLFGIGLYWMSLDPGYVLVRLGGWQAETTAVVTVALLLLLAVVIVVLWRLLRWPFGALSRRHWRLSQRRLGGALVALAEGRYGDAERDFTQAARWPALQGPALLAAAEAAARGGEVAHAYEALDQAGQNEPQAARVLRARLLRGEGRAIEALGLLTAEAEARQLAPGGWHELVLAALDAGQPERSLDALDALHKSGALGVRGYAALEARAVHAALLAVPDEAALDALWSRLPKAQRRIPLAVDAYVRQAARFGAGAQALGELEANLKRDWSSLLVITYGQLKLDPSAQLAKIENWLPAHADQPDLYLSAGRLQLELGQWERARESLAQALALAPTAAIWEALGDTFRGESCLEPANLCYRNALAVSRGETPLPVPQVLVKKTEGPLAVETRDEQGIPQLPS